VGSDGGQRRRGREAETRPHRRDSRAGVDERREESQRVVEPGRQFAVPLAGRRIEQSGCGGDRALGDLRSGQPVTDEVGGQQQLVRARDPAAFAIVVQLRDRVDRGVLQARAREQLLGADASPDAGECRHVAFVTVVVRDTGELRAAEKPVVHPPGVNADARQVARASRLREARDNVSVEPEDVPVQSVDGGNRGVEEPGDLVELHASVNQLTDHDPAARRAEVDGGEPDGHATTGRGWPGRARAARRRSSSGRVSILATSAASI